MADESSSEAYTEVMESMVGLVLAVHPPLPTIVTLAQFSRSLRQA